jgi:hypothetical protein
MGLPRRGHDLRSWICSATPNSKVSIVGRAIVSLGASGVFRGSVIITFHLIPLHKRPIYSGIIGVIFAIENIARPSIGGAFTSHAPRRWCFCLNLPISAVLSPASVANRPAGQSSSELSFCCWSLDPRIHGAVGAPFCSWSSLFSSSLSTFVAIQMQDRVQ